MLKLLSTKVRYLLDVFEYDTTLYPGPPHSVKMKEIQKLFGKIIKFKLNYKKIFYNIKKFS